MSLDTKTFAAWINIGKVLEAWSLYDPENPDDKLRCHLGKIQKPEPPPKVSGKGRAGDVDIDPNAPRIKFYGGFVDKFTAHCVVEQAMFDLLEPSEIPRVKRLLRNVLTDGLSADADDKLISQRNRIMRYVSWVWTW